MNENLAEAPNNQDVILYRTNGRPPVIAGRFFDIWLTFDDERDIPLETIAGWAHIPHYEG